MLIVWVCQLIIHSSAIKFITPVTSCSSSQHIYKYSLNSHFLCQIVLCGSQCVVRLVPVPVSRRCLFLFLWMFHSGLVTVITTLHHSTHLTIKVPAPLSCSTLDYCVLTDCQIKSVLSYLRLLPSFYHDRWGSSCSF